MRMYVRCDGRARDVRGTCEGSGRLQNQLDSAANGAHGRAIALQKVHFQESWLHVRTQVENTQ
jgi:hypothetical protein